MAKPIKEIRVQNGSKGLIKRGEYYHYRRDFNGKTKSTSLKTKNLNQAIMMVLEFNEDIEDKKKTLTL